MKIRSSIIYFALVASALSADNTASRQNLLPHISFNDQKLHPYAKKIASIRNSSRKPYFLMLSKYLNRSFSVKPGGEISINEVDSNTSITQVYQKIDGKRVLIAEDKPVAGVVLENCAQNYKAIIKDLRAQKQSNQDSVPVPFGFMGAYRTPVSDAFYDTHVYNIDKVRAGYEQVPSDIAALAYLELALIQLHLGEVDKADQVIYEGVTNLDLTAIDFLQDAEFRLYLHPSQNFARPECALLFLAGAGAQRRGEVSTARKYYKSLIKGAPSSPFAWEALGKLSSLKGIQTSTVDELGAVLLKTYPLIWGCRRDSVKLGKSQLAKNMSVLLKQVSKSPEKKGDH